MNQYRSPGAAVSQASSFERSVTEADLATLKRAREAADQRYNESLSALDAAVRHLRNMPHAPPGYDEQQIGPLNQRWDLLALAPPRVTSGWRNRLRGFVWRTVAPLFERQHGFNAALVEHINRNISVHHEVTRSVTSTLAVLREELEALIEFETRLVEFAQQVTPFVDTKNLEDTGLMRRISEDTGEIADRLGRQVEGLAGGLSGVADELQKRWESMVARERRYSERVDEIRSTATAWHEVTASLKHELERLRTTPAGTSDDQAESAAVGGTGHSPAMAGEQDSYKYVAFEDKFRGSAAEIRTRVASYVSYFEGASDVLDAGCGRGEFLELLKELGITATGVEINHDMVKLCRSRGLAVSNGDVLSHLTTLSNASLGGLFAAQVVEHLEPAYLLKLLDTAFLKLRPGATLILETINVASWSAFFQSYVRDITHVRPLHPDTLKYLVTASGFQKAEVVYRSPYPPENKLAIVTASPNPSTGSDNVCEGQDANLTQVVAVLNQNVEKLNQMLFSDQDYAVVAERG